MGDDDAGNSAPPDRFHHAVFADRIERADRFVEEDHRRIRRKRAGDFGSLPFAAQKVADALRDRRAIAPGCEATTSWFCASLTAAISLQRGLAGVLSTID